MDRLWYSPAQAFGPLIQAAFSLFFVILAAWCLSAAALWCERRLLQSGKRILWTLPFPVLALGLLYGGLRFSGQLLYPADGWDQWGLWNNTNQNCGATVLFICGCLLTGAVLAVHKEKSPSCRRLSDES